jgi:hypothetical protein
MPRSRSTRGKLTPETSLSSANRTLASPTVIIRTATVRTVTPVGHLERTADGQDCQKRAWMGRVKAPPQWFGGRLLRPSEPPPEGYGGQATQREDAQDHQMLRAKHLEPADGQAAMPPVCAAARVNVVGVSGVRQVAWHLRKSWMRRVLRAARVSACWGGFRRCPDGPPEQGRRRALPGLGDTMHCCR